MRNSVAAECNILRNWGQRRAHLRKIMLHSLQVEEDACCAFDLTNGPDHPQSVTNALRRFVDGRGARASAFWRAGGFDLRLTAGVSASDRFTPRPNRCRAGPFRRSFTAGRFWVNYQRKLVDGRGFEPPASSLPTMRSCTLTLLQHCVVQDLVDISFYSASFQIVEEGSCYENKRVAAR